MASSSQDNLVSELSSNRCFDAIDFAERDLSSLRPNIHRMSPAGESSYGPELAGKSAQSAEVHPRHVHFEDMVQAGQPVQITEPKSAHHTTLNQDGRGRSSELKSSARFRTRSPYPKPVDESKPDGGRMGVIKRHIRSVLSLWPKGGIRASLKRFSPPYTQKGSVRSNNKGDDASNPSALPATDDEDGEYDTETHLILSELILTEEELMSPDKLHKWMWQARSHDL
ncbi:hypothetical protein F4804DRAFT_114325 [Jackrogersella minutella]|nr:hypothetical protein F4804DRAFT_114325 [Jackrogersella minutella]